MITLAADKLMFIRNQGNHRESVLTAMIKVCAWRRAC